MKQLFDEAQLIVRAVNRAPDAVLELKAMSLASSEGKRWASLTGWQRDKYRRQAKRRAKEKALSASPNAYTQPKEDANDAP